MDKKEQAKAVRMEDIYPFSDQLKKIGGLLRGPCPLHSDTTKANFTIYPKTNSWYCFACGKGGDTIAYVMQRDDCQFIQALDVLCPR